MSITAACPVVQPYAAVIIGSVGGFVYYLSSRLLQAWKIDDPLDASPVHFFCGMWGILAAGLFATKKNVLEVYGSEFKLMYYCIIANVQSLVV